MKLLKLLFAMLVSCHLYGIGLTAAASPQNDVLERLSNEFILLYQQGKYPQAIETGRKMLDVAEEVSGHDNTDVTVLLNILGFLYKSQGQYMQAESVFKKSLAINEKAFDSDHPSVATSLSSLAELHQIQGEFALAEPLFQRALAIREKALGADHPYLVTNLNDLAMVHYSLGRYEQAEPLYQRSLTINEKVFGVDHPSVALSLNNLAGNYQDQGQYTQAELLFQRSLAIREKALGADHPDVALSLNNLAGIYRIHGQYAQAEPLYRRSLAINEKVSGVDHPSVALSLNNLAVNYQDQGQYAQAEPLFQRSLAIREKVLGADHPDVALSLNNLAGLYRTHGQYAQAEPLYRRSLAINEKVFGVDHPSVALSLNNLAANYQDQGQYAQAEPLFQRSLAIYEKALGADHPDVALSLNNLAALYQDQGQYAQAESLYQLSLVIYEKAFGADHPDVSRTLQNFAINLWEQDGKERIERAIASFHRSNQIREFHLHNLLMHGSEQEKHDYLATIASDSDVIISFHQAAEASIMSRQLAELAMTTILQRKGRVLDAMNAGVTTLRKHMKPEYAALLDQLSVVNRERSQLYQLAHQSKVSQEYYFSQKTQLEQQAQDIEDKVSAHSLAYQASAQTVTLENVQQAIPQDAVLVEFMRYRPFNPKAKNEQEKWKEARYIVYILRSQGDPVAVDLGEATQIESWIGQFLSALYNPKLKANLTLAARELDKWVMQPVRRQLGETQTLLLSPDGALNRIPFAALVDENNRYLLERYHLTYLSSGRDLLRMSTQEEDRIKSHQPPFIFADADFGRRVDAVTTDKADNAEDNKIFVVENSQNTVNRQNSRSDDFNRMFFQRLPGTKTEAEAIQKILPSVAMLVADKATESAIKQLDSPQILHVATHGFFLADPEDTLPASQSTVLGFEQPNKQLFKENPLLRSGLALANANQLKSGDDDGILTALEVSGLDLWGTQLVVLSACETGVGEVRNGKGVFGLRRALVIAGSETQVMSLWKVDDNATRDLMVDYYTRLVNNKEGRSEAMRQAQLAMLASEDRNHPNYWASFIVSGNWKPLEKPGS